MQTNLASRALQTACQSLSECVVCVWVIARQFQVKFSQSHVSPTFLLLASFHIPFSFTPTIGFNEQNNLTKMPVLAIRVIFEGTDKITGWMVLLVLSFHDLAKRLVGENKDIRILIMFLHFLPAASNQQRERERHTLGVLVCVGEGQNFFYFSDKYVRLIGFPGRPTYPALNWGIYFLCVQV